MNEGCENSSKHPRTTSKMMSRQTMRRDIISIYLKEKENVRELFATCPGRIFFNIRHMEIHHSSIDKEDSDGFEDYATFQSARFRTQVEKSQLDLYLEEPSLDLNSEIDVLEYWSLCSMRHPELSRVARDVLTIQVCTIASENMFGIGDQVISLHNSSLKSRTMEALICLQDWRQAYERARNSGCLKSRIEDETSSSSNDDDDYDYVF